MDIPLIACALLCAAAYLAGQYSQRRFDMRVPQVRAKYYRYLAECIEEHGGNAITTVGLRMMADYDEKERTE